MSLVCWVVKDLLKLSCLFASSSFYSAETVVNKLLRPELTKTNQIWAEDICISWGTGLDLEVISYALVLSRHQCNASMSSTFSWSLCETSRSSESGSQREAALRDWREAKHPGMGFNQDGAEWSPIHAHPHMNEITGKGSAPILTQTAEQVLY